jgi:hypothetical protein
MRELHHEDYFIGPRLIVPEVISPGFVSANLSADVTIAYQRKVFVPVKEMTVVDHERLERHQYVWLKEE